MPEERSLAGSYYLSSLKRLEDFYEDFLKKARDLINIFDTTKVKLPFEKQDKNADSLFLNALKTRLILKRPAGNSYLTSREVMCLQMLEEGKSYKYISSIFDVSPRTIETYISRAKKRTDIHNINDILKLLRIS